MSRQPTKKAGLATLAMIVVMGCNLNKPSVSFRDNEADFDSGLRRLGQDGAIHRCLGADSTGVR